MLGQPASSQTVWSPSRRTRPLSSVYSGPIRARVLIHGGFFSMGVRLLRTSSRSSLRPSGATGDTGKAPLARKAWVLAYAPNGGHRTGQTVLWEGEDLR